MKTKKDQGSKPKVVNVLFRSLDCFNDRPSNITRTRREYFDTPDIEGIEMFKHLKERGFYPLDFSLDDGKTWHPINEYCYANIKEWVGVK